MARSWCCLSFSLRSSSLLSARRAGRNNHYAPVGFELATNGIQYYAIANLDTTSLHTTYAILGYLRNKYLSNAWIMII